MTPPSASLADGVISILICSASPPGAYFRPIAARYAVRVCSLSAAPSTFTTVGVSNNPDSVPAVRRADGASWYNKRPDLVIFFFQIGAHLLEHHSVLNTKKSRNVFSNDPSWPELGDDASHFGPQKSLVLGAGSNTSDRERLAGKAAGEQIGNWPDAIVGAGCLEGSDVADDGGAWPMPVDDGLAIRIDFAEDMFDITPHLIGRKGEAADAREEIDMDHRHGRNLFRIEPGRVRL